MQREFDIIQRYFRDPGLGFAKPGVDLGSGDDCALLRVPVDQQLAISMDLLQEGVHFPPHAVPELVAYRALAVNLSDLAAVGADPLAFTLGLSLPVADDVWLESFSRGLLDCATRYDCPLVGGDLIRGSLTLAIQVQGLVPQGQALLRSGARPGDAICVTGTLGDAAVALAVFAKFSRIGSAPFPLLGDTPLAPADRDHFIQRFYRPSPRVQAGKALRGRASACIDVSDGLLSDLGHVLGASGVGAELNLDQLPCSEAMLRCVAPEHRRQAALLGGDDYELCFTLAPEDVEDVTAALKDLDVPVCRIGTVVAEAGVRCRDGAGAPVVVPGQPFQHFGASEPVP